MVNQELICDSVPDLLKEESGSIKDLNLVSTAIGGKSELVIGGSGLKGNIWEGKENKISLSGSKNAVSFKRRRERKILQDLNNSLGKSICEDVLVESNTFKSDMSAIALYLKNSFEKDLGSKKSKRTENVKVPKPPDLLFSFGGGSEEVEPGEGRDVERKGLCNHQD